MRRRGTRASNLLPAGKCKSRWLTTTGTLTTTRGNTGITIQMFLPNSLSQSGAVRVQMTGRSMAS